jgi:hypothetical protein
VSKLYFTCQQCKNYRTCVQPCIVVEKILEKEMSYYMREKEMEPGVFEIKNWKESYFKTYGERGGISELDELPDDSKERAEEFNFDPETAQARVFYQRFFLKRTFKEIAIRADKSETWARGIYKAATKRVREISSILDSQGKGVMFFQKNPRPLTDIQKWWILHHFFKFSQAEIVRIFPEAPTKANLSRAFRKIRDRIDELRLKDLPEVLAEPE